MSIYSKTNESGIKPYPNSDENNGSKNWNLEDKSYSIKLINHNLDITNYNESDYEQIDSIFVSCDYPQDFFDNNPDYKVYTHNFSILANSETAFIKIKNTICFKGQSIINSINFSNLGIITFSYLRKNSDLQNYNFEILQFKRKDIEKEKLPSWHTEKIGNL